MRKMPLAVIYPWLRITLGCYLFAMAVSFCLEPWNLAPGGVSGLAIVLHRSLYPVIPLETGTLMLLLNLPLLWLGWRRFGGKFLAETIYATVTFALLTNLFHKLHRLLVMPSLCPHIAWAAVFGGILQAAGVGLIFREGGTTGGTDIVVHLLHHMPRWQRIGAGWIFFGVDTAVILLAALTGIGGTEVFFACISLLVFSVTMNRMLGEGRQKHKRQRVKKPTATANR